MYEQVFSLNSRPFTLAPYVKHYFAAESMNRALQQSRSCIERSSGPVIVVGGTGTGKSLLLAMLAEQYSSRFHVVNLASARLDQRLDLLQAILFELKLPYRDMTEGELRLSLNEHLRSFADCPQEVLLLIDEAHGLPVNVLDEVRLITNIIRDGQPCVHLVLAGNPGLEERLIDSKLESLNQRIAARCYLNNLKRNETGQYIVEHVSRVGGQSDLFTTDAIQIIHEKSDGCPRVINQICDHAMILAASLQTKCVTESIAIEAWQDIQCIPGSTHVTLTNNVQNPTDESQDSGIEISTEFSFDRQQSETGISQEAKPDPQPSCSSAVEESLPEPPARDGWSEEGFTTKPIADADDQSWADDPWDQFELQDEPDDVADGSDVPQDPALEMDVSDSWMPAAAESNAANGNYESENDPNDQNASIEQRFNDQQSIEEQLLEKHGLSGHTVDSEPGPAALYEDHDQLSKAIQSIEVLSQDSVDELECRGGAESDELHEGTRCHADSDEFHNPFDESFLHEEQIVNEYSADVAECNLASLGISKQQVQYLDSVRGEIIQDSINSNAVFDESSETRDSGGGSEPASGADRSEVVVSGDEDLQLNKTELRQVDAIQEEVERIEQIARSELNPKVLQNLDYAEIESSSKRIVVTGLEPADDEPLDSDLAQKHRLLEEIRRHQSDLRSLVNSIAEPITVQNDQPTSDSDPDNHCLPLEHPVGRKNLDSVDDQDMLIVSRLEQSDSNIKAEDRAERADDNCATSTGHAIRMDYDQLFEQLRSNPQV